MPPATLTCGTAGTTRTSRSASFRRCGIRGAIRAIEVWLISAFDKWLIIIELFATFDGDGAGVGRRLPFYRGLRLGARSTGSRSFAATIVSGWLGEAELFPLLAQERLARKLDAVAFDAQDLDQYLIAFAELVLHVFHAMFGNLTDVQQTVGTGKDLHESTELSQPHHLAQVGLPYFRNCGEVADHR